MKAANSGVTIVGKPAVAFFSYTPAEPRSACARRAAGVKTISLLL
jgi:hypothetical protein